jgi:hypothetical protein
VPRVRLIPLTPTPDWDPALLRRLALP